MISSHVTAHGFDLRGTKAGDSFMGCKRCWWRSDGAVAMVHQCPQCGSGGLRIFTVDEGDIARMEDDAKPK